MLQKILSRMRKAIEDYHMISDGDKIAVGVSGGKDSQLLLLGLKQLQRFLPQKFEIVAITIDLGFENFNRDSLLRFYNYAGVNYHIEKTYISQVVFEARNEQSPCSLCANMKRGALYSTAVKLGCNKAAFAHHMDDAVETFLMSQISEGRIHTFSPVTYLNRRNITLIRPMIYIEEKLIHEAVKSLKLNPVSSGCPADGVTKRQNIKELIKELSKENRHLKANLFGAIQRAGICDWKQKSKGRLNKYT